MNGILGSFQTNNHDISVQLMRKTQYLSIYNWPEEFNSEFETLFQDRLKESGSLLETNTARSENPEVTPLPPIVEKGFQEHEIERIKEVLHTLHPSPQVLRLYRSTQAVLFNGFIHLAAKRSRYSNASKIIIQGHLYEINQFVHCSVMVHDAETGNSSIFKHWLISCSPYMNHPCKPWFGYPRGVVICVQWQ